MTFVEMIIGAAMAIAGAACLTVLFVRDTAREPIPAPVRVRPADGRAPQRGAVFASQAHRGALRPRNR